MIVLTDTGSISIISLSSFRDLSSTNPGLTAWGGGLSLVLHVTSLFFVCLYLQLMEAMFDYDPFVDSPNQAPQLELMFKKGQVITIYGDMVSLRIKSHLSHCFFF